MLSRLFFLLLLFSGATLAKQVPFQLHETDDNPKHRFPESPPVYPSPQQIPINQAWKTAIKKAKKDVEKLTLEEKVGLGTGNGWPGGLCFGVIKPIDRIGFKGLCIHDGPLGVRAVDLVSAFPAGINAASTFDRSLIRARGEAIGVEYREKGINVYLGPMTNLQRTPWAGRNWEGWGGDPYLAGEATYETIVGVQSKGVQCNVKHFINNEQERDRGRISSNVDDRTQHEIYLPPFLQAVLANTASVMASYNRLNGSWATQNSKTLNGILKGELGFPGYVLSDFFGTQSGVAACNAGLDMPVPIGDYFGKNIVEAVKNGTVNQSRVDDLATRVLSAWYLTGQDKGFPEVNFNAFDEQDQVHNKHVDVQHDHWKIIREIGAASHVLLKNLNETLPLRRPRSLILIGSDAGPPPLGPNYYHDRFITPSDRTGVLAMGWGSGTCYFPYLIDPLSAVQRRAKKEHIDLSWFLDDYDRNEAARLASEKEVAVVFLSADSGEATNGDLYGIGDRPDLEAWHNGTDLVLAVADSNPNTIVVIHSVGPINMEKWIDHPNVKAVLWAGIQGQEVGNALADVLFGDVNPSGRLPYTIAKRDGDYPAKIEHDTDDWPIPQTEYSEGLLVDYRAFDSRNITPRFEFGFGLSYTSFTYSPIWQRSLPTKTRILEDEIERDLIDRGQGSSIREWLHEPRWEINLEVKNEGAVAGHEVVQLYVAFPKDCGEPPKALKGFERIYVQPGLLELVNFKLSYYDLSIWDVLTQRWIKPKGKFRLLVGASSRDIRSEAVLEEWRKFEDEEHDSLVSQED
ncbi:glycoside hydrolase superfamily [Mrakia frigida]|uniref:beta-glucosidase n=1 Tax=Mrakia frigida TaxID=29902 RepID=UPI003FCC14B9